MDNNGGFMKTVDFLKQEDFPGLLLLIKKFSDSTETPFHLHVNEVSASLMEDRVITLVGKDDEKDFPLVTYLCGFFMNKDEFMVSQLYSEDSTLTRVVDDFLDRHLKSCKIKQIVGLSKPDPKIFERYGYKVERYLIVKQLTEKEEKEEEVA